jgi:acetyltransferase-like isoleucine patch superfamily enzyme
MRKITGFEITVGVCLLLCAIFAGIAVGFTLHLLLFDGEYKSICVISSALAGFVIANLIIARICVELFPFPTGEILPGTREERNYNIYIFQTFWVITPLNRCGLIPVPMSGVFYRLLGARIGAGTYTSGTILDPHFVAIGSGSLMGYGSLLVPHSIEGACLAHHPIRIGNQVTVGAHSIVMAGSVIGDRAVVAMNSVVTKGTQIGAGEVWGGTPARFIKTRSP